MTAFNGNSFSNSNNNGNLIFFQHFEKQRKEKKEFQIKVKGMRFAYS